MFGRAWGGSQANDGFCWDVDWASQALPAAQPAPCPPPRLHCAPRVTLEPPPSRSGIAALSAQRATHLGAAADTFSFEDDPPCNPAAQALPSTTGVTALGWRERSNGFLLGAPAPPRRQQLQQQLPRKPAPPAPTTRKPAPQPAKATGVAAAPKPVIAPAAAAPAGLSAQPGGAAGLAGPPATCSLSLEQYLEFWQLLSKGSGRVQSLSELERGMLKAADLKQVLLVQGLNAASRSKKEILDRLGNLQLFSPLCLLPGDAATTGSRAPSPPTAGSQVQLNPEALGSLGSLGWVAPEAVRPGAQQCNASCCALPPVHIHAQHNTGQAVAKRPAEAVAQTLPAQRPWQHCEESRHETPGCVSMAAAGPAQPTDSQATVASLDAAACQHNTVRCSPVVGQQQQEEQEEQQPEQEAAAAAGLTVGSAINQQAAVGMTTEEEEEVEEVEESVEGAGKAPEWLVQGLAEVAERSQGSRDEVTAAHLLGRRICFVLLDQFDQSDARGIVDTLEAGVQEGQVVEAVGVDHDDDCPPGCSQRHAFHYVRVRASKSTAPPLRRAGRRLDLVVDLQPGLRQLELQSLLGVAGAELQEAWVLLEPRAEEAENRGECVQQRAAAAAATQGTGLWRTKRAGQAPAVPVAKRQQSCGGPR